MWSTTLYAYFIPNRYTVTLDRQQGVGGDSSVEAVYMQFLPKKTAPTRIGYNFLGYFTEPNGGGEQYYDSQMNCTKEWNIPGSSTLYAHWKGIIYTVTLHDTNDFNNNTYSINVSYGSTMPLLEFIPVKKTGYSLEGIYSHTIKGEKYKKYYSMTWVNNPREAAANGFDEYWEEAVVPYDDNNELTIWDILGDGDLYAHFVPLEMEYKYVRMEETTNKGLGMSGSIHFVHGQNVTIKAEKIQGYKFLYFKKGSKKAPENNENTITFAVRLSRGGGSKNVFSDYYVSAWYKQDECVAAGTLITLADGRQVPVETLKGDEMLLVWNMLTGEYDASRILFIDSDPAQVYKVINLGFSDGTTVKVISEHGFWDYDLNKYVYLRQDASKYIGHWFNKGDIRVQLTSVDVRDEYTTAYSPVTYGHLCYFVNGMLSMPGGISGLFNIFEVDPDTMSINAEAMAQDIAKYGLFSYEEFAELLPVSEDIFNAFNGQYLKVAIGKGLITVEQLDNLVNRYSQFFQNVSQM